MADVWLIDANTLWKCETCFYDSKNGCRTYCDHGENYRPAYDKLKTIDPESLRPVGEWKPYYDYFTKRQVGWICTNCSGVQVNLRNGDTAFCPNCGARMKGENDG